MSDTHQPAAGPDQRATGPATAEDDIDDAAYRSGLPGPLGFVDRGIARLEAVILALGVLAMAVNTVANVVGRFVFGRSLYFAEEVNAALIVLITFAGISYAARHGRHIRMSAILDMLPVGPRKLAMIAISALTAALLFLLSWYALDYVMTQASRGRVLPALRIPQWWTLVWVPVGLFLTALQYALTALHNATHPGVWLSTGVKDGYAPAEPEDRP
ncbi:TRAP transporter small permease [Paracoccus tibetensis]|uniref:TRAP transporter small permease protein n=1 Tax=Paracoccus tibetensis TaxID=336292 RepID=A0A1G5JXW6_9RHOB|nr:TRAP transporter small permease [Paracoccus tibetensis]SCY93215.1 TRAP-type C4-dicarboxylate transport system, small permease component [Paracoccus tibetensis]